MNSPAHAHTFSILRIYASAVSLTTAGIGLAVLVVWLFDIVAIKSVQQGLATNALHTGFMFLIFANKPARGVMKIFTSDLPGSRSLRTLLPITIVIIIFLALLVERGESLGFYDATNKSVVLVILLILVLSPLIYINARNISRMEEALRKAESKFRTLVEQIPAITYIATTDEFSQATYVSPQISVLGFSPDEWITGLWAKQLHPDDRDRVLAEVHQSQVSGELFSSEYRLLTRDGQTRWYNDEAVVVRDSWGQPSFLQGVMFDITDRRRAEEALQASEELFRTAFDSSPVGMCMTTLDGSLMKVNQAFSNTLGFTKMELQGKHFNDLTHPEDLEIGREALRQMLSGEIASAGFEKRYLHKNGEPVWAYVNSSLR